MTVDGAISRIASIRNQRGLHARAAAKFVKLAGMREGHSLTAAVTAAQEAGRKYINVASQLLAARG